MIFAGYNWAVDAVLNALAITFILIVWFETNAFAEYARLFGARLESY